MRTNLTTFDVMHSVLASLRNAMGKTKSESETLAQLFTFEQMPNFTEVSSYIVDNTGIDGQFTGSTQDLIDLVKIGFSDIPSKAREQANKFSRHFDSLIRGGYEKLISMPSLSIASLELKATSDVVVPTRLALLANQEKARANMLDEGSLQALTDLNLKNLIRRVTHMYAESQEDTPLEVDGIFNADRSQSEDTTTIKLTPIGSGEESPTFTLKFNDVKQELESLEVAFGQHSRGHYVYRLNRAELVSNINETLSAIDEAQLPGDLKLSFPEEKVSILERQGTYYTPNNESVPSDAISQLNLNMPVTYRDKLTAALEYQQSENPSIGFTEALQHVDANGKKTELLSEDWFRSQYPCFWV